jgi:hypothetical protein
MIDPFTAMAAATAAFNGIKKAVSVGKDITSMGNTLSSWSKAISDLDFLDEKAKKPPLYKMFTNTQSDALDIWSKKQKLKEMREELRSHISWTYGPSAWDEIVKIEADQRKAQREAVYAKQEQIDKIINSAIVSVIVIAAISTAGGIIWYIGAAQGKW